jgi:hypothetical protein
VNRTEAISTPISAVAWSVPTMHNRCLAILAAALWAPALRAQPRAPASCDPYQIALQADSTNLDAAARLGQCSVRDYEMIAPGGDSTRLVFRSSWSAALRALRRAVALDPGYSRAYRPLFAILFAETPRWLLFRDLGVHVCLAGGARRRQRHHDTATGSPERSRCRYIRRSRRGITGEPAGKSDRGSRVGGAMGARGT